MLYACPSLKGELRRDRCPVTILQRQGHAQQQNVLSAALQPSSCLCNKLMFAAEAPLRCLRTQLKRASNTHDSASTSPGARPMLRKHISTRWRLTCYRWTARQVPATKHATAIAAASRAHLTLQQVATQQPQAAAQRRRSQSRPYTASQRSTATSKCMKLYTLQGWANSLPTARRPAAHRWCPRRAGWLQSPSAAHQSGRGSAAAAAAPAWQTPRNLPA